MAIPEMELNGNVSYENSDGVSNGKVQKQCDESTTSENGHQVYRSLVKGSGKYTPVYAVSHEGVIQDLVESGGTVVNEFINGKKRTVTRTIEIEEHFPLTIIDVESNDTS